MLKLVLDPRGGLSGDMFAAGLLSMCREKKTILDAMTQAGNSLGKCSIDYTETQDGSGRLKIAIESMEHCISEDDARDIISRLFDKFGVGQYYRELGLKMIEILISAEKEAHSKYDFFKKENFKAVQHIHSHDHDEKAHLHEAQDIVIDIIGSVMGLQCLGADASVIALYPVSAGGGKVECSHGMLFVPAPATSIILKKYSIPWVKGPLDYELLTPTGASIMAGLSLRLDESTCITDPVLTGLSRGSKEYPIPPLKLYLIDFNKDSSESVK